MKTEHLAVELFEASKKVDAIKNPKEMGLKLVLASLAKSLLCEKSKSKK